MITLLIGNDTEAIKRELASLKVQTHPVWRDFNVHRFSAEQLSAAIMSALSVPLGEGSKLIIVEGCDFKQFGEMGLEILQPLSMLPKTTHLVFIATSIDKRLKVSKHLLSLGKLKEFNLIPPWRTDLIEQAIANTAKQMQLTIARDAVSYLAQAIGNDTTRMVKELEKLAVYAAGKRITKEQAILLIPTTTSNSLQLAQALLEGKTIEIVRIVRELLSRAEFPLVIVATLITQFKTWLWVKAALVAKRSEEEIASLCGLGNPKRMYFLRQEVKEISINYLSRALSMLFELEVELKSGEKADSILPALLRICLS
ncbi:DNA polymerase III subunit delta [Phormidium sp. LEGE 05292]|uniref:DNA polymerase III subunit delta n=1 Tax=[Phormidium] sp. LEGE 05292 TaxID=767427 RepID=UPI00187F2FFA|nr:DNA polymerase III subunit delta [Phormidium sp. LEGE 05292]MBE9224133.1 DNA polymerase III subunit delta [Phormidium sp. LEGE 05292]